MNCQQQVHKVKDAYGATHDVHRGAFDQISAGSTDASQSHSSVRTVSCQEVAHESAAAEVALGSLGSQVSCQTSHPGQAGQVSGVQLAHMGRRPVEEIFRSLFLDPSSAEMSVDWLRSTQEEEARAYEMGPPNGYLSEAYSAMHVHAACDMVYIRNILNLTAQTLHLGMALLDVAIPHILPSVPSPDIPLYTTYMAIACCQIAGKFEEIEMPSYQKYVDMYGNKVLNIQPRELVRVENAILDQLDYKLPPYCTPVQYLNLYSIAAITGLCSTSDDSNYPQLLQQLLGPIESLAQFALDLSLGNVQLLRERPSKLAAAAVLLARAVVLYQLDQRIQIWDAVLHQYTSYSFWELSEVAEQMHNLLSCTWRHRHEPDEYQLPSQVMALFEMVSDQYDARGDQETSSNSGGGRQSGGSGVSNLRPPPWQTLARMYPGVHLAPSATCQW